MGTSANPKARLEGLDAARGAAIALMFLSHTVKSLLSFGGMPRWGIVPVHAMTKFSSALFILVFGVTLVVVYLPKVDTAAWPSLRWKLVKRAALIMLWYKILIVVQMFQRSPVEGIWRTLTWQRFPDFVEILQFYAWFVLLLPLILPAWRALPMFGRAGMVLSFGLVGWALRDFDFWGVWQLKAVLVEEKGYFCFGVITRGTMALFGLLLGDLFLSKGDRDVQSAKLAVVVLSLGVACLGGFIYLHHSGLFAEWGYGQRTLDQLLRALAFNYGKHPPNLPFVLFSNGGAMTLLGLFLLARGPVLVALKPLSIIGRESLFCFNFHIVWIFVVYRYLFDLRRNVTYGQALWLTAGVFVAAIAAAKLNSWRKRKQPMRRMSDFVRERGPFGSLNTEEARVAAEFDASSDSRR